MRIIEPPTLNKANLAPHERFFVELWYGMTHQQSLDSYRVRCMNSRTIIRELSEEIQIGRISDNELKDLCREVIQILADDPLIKQYFPTNEQIIKPFLDDPPVVKEKQDKSKRNDTEAWHRFGFATEDFAVVLERSYFRHVVSSLPDAIKPDNQEVVFALIGALLSDLVDQGWSLESLNRWHTVFLPGKKNRPRTFEQNLAFMLKQLSKGKQEFEVILRLSGTDRLNNVKSFHDLTLTSEISIAAKTEAQKRFSTQNVNVTFATTTIEAVDATASAIAARAIAEQLLDLLRFDYEHRTIAIEDACYVRRLADNHIDLLRVRHAVPNPRETTDEADFIRFVNDIDGVISKEQISAVSRQQLEATIRQYRFGKDSERYRDKFLNWWMGLESLCGTIQGKSIGEAVTWKVSRAMAHRYFFRLLRDLLITLKYLKVDWPDKLAEKSGCPKLVDLTVSQLITVLQSEPHARILLNLCADHPVVIFRCEQIIDAISTPDKALTRLELHWNHLNWHLNRLYRIRCCLVHGSPIRFPLALYAANLEFYLKEAIRFTLAAFLRNDHIKDLEELFQRGALTYDRVIESLKSSNANPDTVREAVFMDVVVQEKGD